MRRTAVRPSPGAKRLHLKDATRSGLLGIARVGLVCGVLLVSGCLPGGRMPQMQNFAAEVADTAVFPQSLAFFAQQAGGMKALRSDADAAKDMEAFRKQFFAPWSKTSADADTFKYFAEVLAWKGERRGYAENMRLWSDEAWDAMVRNAALVPDGNSMSHPALVRSAAPAEVSAGQEAGGEAAPASAPDTAPAASASAPAPSSQGISTSEDELAVVSIQAVAKKDEAAPAGLATELISVDPVPTAGEKPASPEANAHAAAISVRPADLRVAPTVRPRFASMDGAGQGWPFDSFQQSSIPAGLPLMLHHVSRDGAWYLVESSCAWGWIQADAVALVDKAFEEYWRSQPLGAFVQDDVSLAIRKPESCESRGMASAFLTKAHIGTVLPMPLQGQVILPLRSTDGTATAVSVRLGRESSAVAAMPLRLTPHAVARIGDRMMGQPYGWGGMYGRRDCSAMMRDMFTPFGIWLPRHSSAQARAGEQVSVEGLPALEKEAAVMAKAEPFRSLLWMPGHIGLYLGEFQGQPAWFHDMWGLRITLKDGRDGRAIVGRAVVTGLRPGRERGDVKPEALLIERIHTISHLKN